MIGKRIGQLRKEQRLSQSALARAIGLAQSAVSQIESGVRNPSYTTLKRIARALHISVSDLVGAPEKVSTQEAEHIRQYRALPPAMQAELRKYAEYLLTKKRRKTEGNETSAVRRETSTETEP